MRVLIVRDRPSVGGGIVSYYDALDDYFAAGVAYTPVGRPYAMYASGRIPFHLRHTWTRLLCDYGRCLYRLVVFRPAVVSSTLRSTSEAKRSPATPSTSSSRSS